MLLSIEIMTFCIAFLIETKVAPGFEWNRCMDDHDGVDAFVAKTMIFWESVGPTSVALVRAMLC